MAHELKSWLCVLGDFKFGLSILREVSDLKKLDLRL